jgi:hypothetical protein
MREPRVVLTVQQAMWNSERELLGVSRLELLTTDLDAIAETLAPPRGAALRVTGVASTPAAASDDGWAFGGKLYAAAAQPEENLFFSPLQHLGGERDAGRRCRRRDKK